MPAHAMLEYAGLDGRRLLTHEAEKAVHGVVQHVQVRDKASGELVCTKSLFVTDSLFAVLEYREISREKILSVALRHIFDFALHRIAGGHQEDETVTWDGNATDAADWADNKVCDEMDRKGNRLICRIDKNYNPETTQAACNACHYPEIYYRCRHMVNPTTQGHKGPVLSRHATVACNLGKPANVRECPTRDCREPWLVELEAPPSPITYRSAVDGGQRVTILAVGDGSMVNIATGGSIIAGNTAQNLHVTLSALGEEYVRLLKEEPLEGSQAAQRDDIITLLGVLVEQTKEKKPNPGLAKMCLDKVKDMNAVFTAGSWVQQAGQKLMEFLPSLMGPGPGGPGGLSFC